MQGSLPGVGPPRGRRGQVHRPGRMGDPACSEVQPDRLPRARQDPRRKGSPTSFGGAAGDAGPKWLEEQAGNWDLRHEDFNDNDFLYDVYSVMRSAGSFAHTDDPFLSA